MKSFNSSSSFSSIAFRNLRRNFTEVNNQLIAYTLNPFKILLLTVFALLLVPHHAMGDCGTPINLKATVSGNVVTFSWSGTGGADIHAILLKNEQTGQNSNGYSSVGDNFATMTVAPGTYVWRVKSLCNTAQKIAEDSSAWIWSAPFTMAKTNNNLPQAHAGCDQVNVSGTSTELSAMSLLDGTTGHWTILSGTGGSFSNSSSATSSFTGIAGTTYILRWTVSNEFGSSFHDVLISFCTPPSQAQAGVDQLNINGNNTTLSAIGNGVWTVISGLGGSFANTVSATSAFVGLNTTYVLRWIVSNACGSEYDDVTVSFCTSPSLSNAGDDQSISGTSTILAAIAPIVGNGKWTIVNGIGGVLGDAFSPTSTFEGIDHTNYILRWTVGNGCGSNSDDVIVSFCTLPSQAYAGTDQSLSGSTTTLAASTPTEGNGMWSIVSGIGGILGDASNPTSSFQGSAGTTYVLRWTVSNSCGINSDEVTVGFNQTSVTDIDGNIYSVVKIGNQIWMSENLKTTKYNDGSTIPNVTDNSNWINLTTGAWAYSENDPSRNNPYGKLYNFQAVGTGKLCPNGWHIPSNADWTEMINYLGGESVAGGKMKSTTGWNSPNTGATNESGFTGVAGGFRLYNYGLFTYLGMVGYWWSSTQYNADNAYSRNLSNNSSSIINSANMNNNGYSCRCVKD